MNYNTKQFVSQAIESGFSQAGELNVKALNFLPEVRDMCSADLCRSYGRNWCCPPACGTLEEVAKKASEYSYGIIVQTIGNMSDDFDYETIAEAGTLHSGNFQKLIGNLKQTYPDILPMGAGACTLCKKCSYPELPCVRPDEAIVSMEAYGLFVSDVCTKSDIPYNNGKQTITYTSCYLLK